MWLKFFIAVIGLVPTHSSNQSCYSKLAFECASCKSENTLFDELLHKCTCITNGCKASYLAILWTSTFFVPGAYVMKNITILYDIRYSYLVSRIKCSLSSLQPHAINEIALPTGQTLLKTCLDPLFRSQISMIHLTVTVTDAAQLETFCERMASIMHFKMLGNQKWVAHILTPRTDIVIPLSFQDQAISDGHFDMIMEAFALAWGPLFGVPGPGQKFKFLDFKFEEIVKHKIYLLPAVAIAMVFCVGLVCAGTYIARRRKAENERRALQNQRAELLSDWGHTADPSQESMEVTNDWADMSPAPKKKKSTTDAKMSAEKSGMATPLTSNDNAKNKSSAENVKRSERLSIRESLYLM